MSRRNTMLKVLSPVEGRNGKTFWIRVGNAFVNRDGSTNVYLNAYPTSGKLQIRELDESDLTPRNRSAPEPLGTAPTEAVTAPTEMVVHEDLPF